jgi:hypothetical protein
MDAYLLFMPTSPMDDAVSLNGKFRFKASYLLGLLSGSLD